MSTTEQFYDAAAQREWERLDRFPMELALTRRALDRHLPPPPASVLDVGGGPGRYAIALAQQGYQVTLLDLSRPCLDLAAVQAARVGVELAAILQADARDLQSLPTAGFDAVLLMGPLYHLFTHADRQRALDEARRVLRPDGVLAAALLTRYALIRWVAKHQPEWLLAHPVAAQQMLETGLAVGDRRVSFADVYLAHPHEVPALLHAADFELVDLIACEGVVGLIDDQLKTLTGDAWVAWVDLNESLCRDPAIAACADHLLAIAHRRAASH